MPYRTNIHPLGSKTPVFPDDGNVLLAPDAQVIGDVHIGSGCSIWFGAVLRADNAPIRIGDGTNIQDHCVLHVDPGLPLRIGANCTIGHRAIVHGCHIGDGSLIGMGAIVLNGASIGRRCLIGAGALVTERAEIPDETLVLGSPARIKRQLDEKEIAALALSAAAYREKIEPYRAQFAATADR